MRKLWMVLLAGLIMSGVASAYHVGEEDGLQILLKQQRELRADLEDGGIEGLTPRQNSKVRKAQQEVFAITEGKNVLDDLSIDQKIRLENALELINAEVVNTQAASANQQVCWRETKAGTTIKVTICGSKAERDHAREGARGWMEKPKICVPPGCS